MSDATAEHLLAALGETGLIPDAHLRAAVAGLADPARVPARQLADRLISAGLLTDYQARLLVDGRGGETVIAGKYKVLDVLGRGGMGSVFLCEHSGLKTLVAVKVLSDTLDDPTARARFYREARAFATLNHPNLVRGFDVDANAGRHFLVMEYVDGVDLQTLLGRVGPLPVGRAVNYVRQAARGLSHAHAHGWVHRDIKPSNLAVDRAGVVRVLDMGLARLVLEGSDGVSRNYDDQSIRGTADYMSPEQASGRPVDGRTDLYSLGVTLYYLLTARLPFDEETTAAKLVAHAVHPPRPVRAVRPDLPAGLAAVIARLLEKRPAARPASADEVIDALAAWDDGPVPPLETEAPRRLGLGKVLDPTTPLRPLPPSLTSPATAGRRRLAGWAAVSGLIVAVSVAIALVAALTRPPTEGRPPPPTTGPTRSPFWGNYVCVTRAHGPGQVPFPGGHDEYLDRPVYQSVAAALSDPRVNGQEGGRILLLDEYHEEQAVIDADAIPPGVSVESARPGEATQWGPPEGADPTRPLLTVTGGQRFAVRRVTFNGMRRVESPVVWERAGGGCEVTDCRVTLFTRTGVTFRSPSGGEGEAVRLSACRVDTGAEAAVDTCVAVRGSADKPAGHLRITGCRLEGPAGEAVLVDGPVSGLVLTQCRLFLHGSGVRIVGGHNVQVSVAHTTTARVTTPVRVDGRLATAARVEVTASLFFNAATAARGPVDGGDIRDGGGNWCEAGGCPTPSHLLSLTQAAGLTLGLDPSDDAKFLRYPPTSPLRTAGPGGQPVGESASSGPP